MVTRGMDLRKPAQPSAGFTLVELLVTLAIIGVLAALLFPVINSARARAHETRCISNLRQIGMAFSMYRQDFDHRPPEICDLYPNYVSSAALFQCPRDNWLSERGWAFAAWGKYVNPPLRVTTPVSYGYFFTPTIFQRDKSWNDIEEAPYPAGYLVCVLHGSPNHSYKMHPSDAPHYQGKCLRLLFSGAVVSREIPGRFSRNALLTQ